METQYVVFGRGGQFIVTAESRPMAIQLVLVHTDTLGQPFAADTWQANALNRYTPQTRKELIAESVKL